MSVEVRAILTSHIVHAGATVNSGIWWADCLANDCDWSDHGERGAFAAAYSSHNRHVVALLDAYIEEVVTQRLADQGVSA